eukprot:6404507-Ditylum_brightwellii.AAC.1
MCGGTTVEIGALDGILYSNSYYLERSLNWTALLIEANLSSYAALEKNRPGPLAHKFHAAMCYEESVDFIIGKSSATGGVASTMGEKHKEFWSTNNTITVPCSQLSKVFSSAGVRHIDVFFLDVEGGEAAVLRTMD